jgi:mRNA interferase MazF
MFTKDFDGWAELKPKLHSINKANIYFQERDVWWCSLGCNIGGEQDGKNAIFNRPVLVSKKFNHDVFYGLPMTTKNKDNPYYIKITFGGREVSVLLSQMRIFDKKRFQRKIGQLDTADFERVIRSFKNLFITPK